MFIVSSDITVHVNINTVIIFQPDEKQEHAFSAGDLRYSKEWFDNGWQNIKPKPDVVSKLDGSEKISETKKDEPPSSVKIKLAVSLDNDALNQKMIKTLAQDDKMVAEPPAVRDLTKDYLLAKLRWRSSGKRSRGRSPVKSCPEAGLSTFKGVFVNSSMKLDQDHCKSSRDSRFSSSVVSPMSNLVMSR